MMRIGKVIHRAIRINPALGRLAINAIPNLSWKISVRGIGLMAINLRRNRCYWLRDMANEDFVLCAMQRLVRPGDVVFDAGANIGLCVRFLVQHFGASRVIAFEPMRGNQALLNQNIH